MTDEIEQAKKSLNVLSEVFELGSNFSEVSKILKGVGSLAKVFPVVGAVLELIQGFLPADDKFEEVLRCLKELSNKIDQVREDIKKLNNEIAWNVTVLQYGEAVGRIVKGMKLCSAIGQESEKAKKNWCRDRLMEFCAAEDCSLALDNLLGGVIGGQLFNLSILDEFYKKTDGDRPKISSLATRLLQLVCGGMMVIATYETMKRGKEAAEQAIKPYEGQFKDVYTKVQSLLDKCVENFKDNMLNDLNAFLDKGGSNMDVRAGISNFMSNKYDWLENYCLVYNDLQGFAEHCIGGDRVDSLHRNGKCGVVFYRTKGETPRCSDRYDEAHEIVDDAGCVHAEACFNGITAKINERRIGWTGCAVIKKEPDLFFGGTFSTKIVYINKRKTFNAVYNNITATAQVILLLA